MLTQWIDGALDHLHFMLTGSARERRDNPEAAAIAGALVLTCLAFGFELTNPTLGVDDFGHLDMPFQWDVFWIGRGMWGGLLVQYLTPGGWITPLVPLVIGILLQLLSAVLVGWGLGVRGVPPLQLALLYASFAAFPYFACQMAFSYAQIAFPLASLLMVCGVLLALEGELRRGLCAAAAIGFGISIYQGALSVLGPVALLAPLAGHGVSRQQIVRRYRRVLLAVLAGVVLYLAVHKLILAVTGVVPQNQHYSVSFDWRFWERWLYVRRDISFLFFGAGGVIPAKAVGVFLLAALILLLHQFRQPQSVSRRLQSFGLGLLFGVLLVASPFPVLFLHAGELAPRSSVGVGVVWFVLFAYLLTVSSPWIRRAGVACLAVTVAFFVFHDNRMFYTQFLVTQADNLMMTRIAERIDRLALRPDGAATEVVVIGNYSHPPYEGMPRFKGDVLGYSQFEWGYNDSRWLVRGLARSIGVDRYVWRSREELGGAFVDPALLQGRQPWPHANSVFAHDGYAVVWLGQRREEPRDAPFLVWFNSLFGGRLNL